MLRFQFAPVQLEHVLYILNLAMVGFDHHLEANPHARDPSTAVAA
jgi:hypothetical protein